jgi:S-DNA-T family DNA segregation ATPase FtsK/SpoIIIE
LGRDVAGRGVYANLAKMPHLLIAGATGSGKSIGIHALILSLLYRNGPDRLRFLIIDPKKVELAYYSLLPHLLSPVVVDSKKAVQALRWAVSEMDRRFEILAEAQARDVNSYQNSADAKENPMPFIVIVIDELADLMATHPREMESLIVRLAQMSRAVGIHLVVSTQRPSIDVITGLIKANITNRIAFQVASQVDSRTILDMSGAEKLLGAGDMLFISSDSGKPRRIQGVYVSEPEIKRVVKFLEEEYGEEGPELVNFEHNKEEGIVGEDGFEDFGVDDPLYPQAKELVIQAGKASASYLQRRLSIGYARAARLLDILEEKGVIGPGQGAKPREVLVDKIQNPEA